MCKCPYYFRCIVIMIFKGKGRDLLLIKYYCDITLTTLLEEFFELLHNLNCMTPTLMSQVFHNKYRQPTEREVRYVDSIFAGKEAITRFNEGDDCIYSCFYSATEQDTKCFVQ